MAEHHHSLRWGCANETAMVKSCTPSDSRKGHSQAGEDEMLYTQLFCHACTEQQIYVEIGALNGVSYSNTLMFEKSLNWGGLLIEGNPVSARALVQARGKSGKNMVINEAVCLQPGTVAFVGGNGGAVGGVRETMSDTYFEAWNKRHRFSTHYTVPCRPISDMLHLAGLSDGIDLFSLDVEGAELLVLQTMDWSIPVKVFVIEMPNEGPHPAVNQTKADQIRALLSEHDYVEAPSVRVAHNVAFVHANLSSTLTQRIEECGARVQACKAEWHAKHAHAHGHG